MLDVFNITCVHTAEDGEFISKHLVLDILLHPRNV